MKTKFCGMRRVCDIEAANEVKPDFVGFVFAPKSKRYITYEKARELKAILSPQIKAVGVFVGEEPEQIAKLLEEGVIEVAQLHGGEDEEYIRRLRELTDKPIMQAFRIENKGDVERAERSTADMVLLDSGAGTGEVFDWKLIEDVKRPYFLAGGLSADNVATSIERLHPYGVDVSSGIEREEGKDKRKMRAFIQQVREAE